MEKLLAALDAALDQTELALAQENNEPAGYRLPAGLAERQALREQVKASLAQLAAEGRNHHHPVEPEARRMRVGVSIVLPIMPRRWWTARKGSSSCAKSAGRKPIRANWFP